MAQNWESETTKERMQVRRRRRAETLTVPARAEPGGERPGGFAEGEGEGTHSAVVPLSGGGGHVAEVTLELLDPLTAHHVQPLRLPITTHTHTSSDPALHF